MLFNELQNISSYNNKNKCNYININNKNNDVDNK